MPNLFFLLGPNTGLGHNSVVFMIESQIRYVAEAIAACDKLGAQALAPTRAAQDGFNDELQDEAGRLGVEHRRLPQLVPRRARQEPVLWGGYTWQYWLATRSLKPAEYQFFGVGTGLRPVDSFRAGCSPTSIGAEDYACATRETQHLVLRPVVAPQG